MASACLPSAEKETFSMRSESIASTEHTRDARAGRWCAAVAAVRTARLGTGAQVTSCRWGTRLDVPPEQSNRWVTSRPFGAGGHDARRLLGYQGWWQHSPGVGKADISTRVIAHARHERGRLLWLGSRTNVETPGDVHKHVIVAIIDDDR